MKENPFNGNQENIFRKFEEKSELIRERNELNTDNPNTQNFDDSEPISGMARFLGEHQKLKRGMAAAGAFLTIASATPAFGSENQNPTQTESAAIEYKQTESVDQKYSNALNKLLADASTVNTESVVSKEKIQSPLVTKLLIQTDSPYCEVTNSITGDVGVLKKTDSSVSMVNGRNMVPIRWAEYLGYEVTWDGTTKTATITNDEKKVRLTLGSKIMTVEETGKETKKITMDVATQTDKNGRTVIPIGFFGREAMGADVQWDGKTKTIGVNYSVSEFAKVVKTEVLNKELKYQALKYINGGEYMDASKFYNPLEKLSVGATVVYSSEKNKATEKKEVAKYQSKIKNGDVVYCVGGKTYLVRPITSMENGLRKENVYKLNDMKEVSFSKLIYYPAIRVDYKTNGLAATDSFRVTHDYNSTSNKWVERKDYEMIGNPNQRIRKNLTRFLTNTVNEYDDATKKYTPISNVLLLDKNEVSEYCITGKDENFKSFKILKYANGDPASFVVVGGENGVGEKLGARILKAVDRFNEIDPEIMHLMCDREGLSCITYDMSLKTQKGFFDRKSWFGTYMNYPFGQIVYINKNSSSSMPEGESGDLNVQKVMFVESRALYYRQHMSPDGQTVIMSDKLSDKPGIINEEADKYRFMIKTINEKWLPSGKLTKSEYTFFMTNLEPRLKSYDPSYQLTWSMDFDSPYFAPEK